MTSSEVIASQLHELKAFVDWLVNLEWDSDELKRTTVGDIIERAEKVKAQVNG